jgi:thiamine-phosphate pyrophosphorylase
MCISPSNRSVTESPHLPSVPDRPIICYVTNRNAAPPSAVRETFVLECIARAIEAGIDWIQIREKDLATAKLLALVKEAVRLAAGTGCQILVNGRLDIALAANAHGIHLGGDAIPAQEAIGWLREWREKRSAPAEFLVGVSCHSLTEAKQAETNGANYIFFGPVFDSPAKREFGQPQGVDRLNEVCQATRIPVIAIGGIDVTNIADCLKVGAVGIAAISLFQQSHALAALADVIEIWRTSAGPTQS